MKRLWILLVLCVSTVAFGADRPEDGIYVREQGRPAPMILSQDGQEIFFGRKQDLKILTSGVSSQNNANDRFSLALTIPYDPALDPGTYVLIVSGHAYPQGSSGSSGQETSSLSFIFSGEENARQVSQYLKTPIVYRRHPGHHLRVSFLPARQEFAMGDEVAVTLQIVNAGPSAVAFMKGGRNRAERDNQYVFSARYEGRQVEDIGTSHHFGGIAVKKLLQPGEIFEDVISLKKWFAFDQPGFYEIHGSYYLDFQDPDSGSWRTLWEDYVSADFMIWIGQGAEIEIKK